MNSILSKCIVSIHLASVGDINQKYKWLNINNPM
jgi:hypothetical protein